MDQSVHRPTTRQGSRRPAHPPRAHHRHRHRVLALPPRPQPQRDLTEVGSFVTAGGESRGHPPTHGRAREYRRIGHSPYGLGPRDDTRANTSPTTIRHYPTSTSTIAKRGHFKPS